MGPRTLIVSLFLAALVAGGVVPGACRAAEPVELFEQGDFAAAKRGFLAQARAGDPMAQNNLGVMYAKGLGGEQSFEKAAGWYGRAANQGLPLAQYNLAGLYEQGRGLPMDPVTAAVWYRMAAMQGEVLAQYSLGSLYAAGTGVEGDDVEAYFWLSLALGQPQDWEFRDEALRLRRDVSARMTRQKIVEAELLVGAWMQRR